MEVANQGLVPAGNAFRKITAPESDGLEPTSGAMTIAYPHPESACRWAVVQIISTATTGTNEACYMETALQQRRISMVIRHLNQPGVRTVCKQASEARRPGEDYHGVGSPIM